jgi:hypothetical protein
MITRARRSLRNRRTTDSSLRPRGDVIAVTPTVSATKLRLTFGEQVSYSGETTIQVSGGTHGAGASPTAVTKVTPTVFDLSFATNVIATDVCVIPPYDSGFRSPSGGYANPGSTILP